MQEAGRILLMPKGDYSTDATYEMLDLVNHNGASWVCKQDCTGQEPSDSNTDFWQRFGTAVDMSNLDAKTLDGHEAEYFAPKTDLANYLPLTGGTLNDLLVIKAKNGSTALLLQSAKSDASLLKFTGLNGVQFGFLGFNGAENPVVYGSNGQKAGTILHTGNKPTGTYTGNGDATERTITTGALFSSNGGACIVYNNSGIAIVTHKGATSFTDSGVNRLSAEEAKYLSGNIVLNTSDAVLNAGGSTTTYIVV